MYESPLTEICENIESQMTKQREDSLVYEIRQAVGYNIDKEELIKALQYDRNQYQKGYADALSVIEDIKAEIADIYVGYRHGYEIMADVLAILDKHIGKEKE